MKRLKSYWIISLIIFLGLLISWPIFVPGYFSHHDDLQVMRIFEMRKCLADFQIPCRWVPDMGFGNGYPLFNYYPPLPYYIGAVLSFIFGYIGAAKILFLLPLLGGGFSMYLLAKELFGEWGGLASTILYLYAPYRALDLYVRGAIAESFAMALIPLVCYFILKTVKDSKSLVNFYGLSISFGLFLLSHNIMALLYLPLILFWLTLCLYQAGFKLKYHYLKRVGRIMTSLIIGFFLAAFFILPAFFEKGLVQTENLITGDLSFRVHFVTLRQLFLDRQWGYGASVPGPNDTISFQIGWPHWWLIMGAIVLGVIVRRQLLLTAFILLIFVVSVLMTHNKSAFIWEKLSLLQYTQFPWRFLALAIFATSLTGGLVVSWSKQKFISFFTLGLVVLTVILNWGYFKPEVFYTSLTDQQKLTGKLWQDQQKAAILDYLPKTSSMPREPASEYPKVFGKGKAGKVVLGSNNFRLFLNADQDVRVELPILDFPNWQIRANGRKIPHTYENYLGRVILTLPAGNYQIEGRLTDTLIRTVANGLTVFSLIFLGIFWAYPKKGLNHII